ncbi:MAG: anhydro-N-acetylmuramic acid kinase, partial [Caldilineaceae bacterium]|nr:anhydro-N-acetylmuramic acid kinase [Caldilineaceae bacterium]
MSQEEKLAKMRVIGMMSGTSVDGIDVVVADLVASSATSTIDAAPPTAQVNPARTDESPSAESALTIQQLAFTTIPWAEDTRRTIFSLIQETTSAAALCEANFTVAHAFVDALKQVLETAKIPLQSVDLIASHGQTIWHNVSAGKVTSTLQIGDPSVIAARTGITTVGNFRTADVAVGGQGAPLVSLYDWYFLRPPVIAQAESIHWRAVQNIGGIGNVTFLPPWGCTDMPLAFDTGPGNVFIDWAAAEATAGTQTYDHDGQLARDGYVSEPLLQRCLSLPYFQQVPPKSTGRELFDNKLVAEWWAVAQQMGLSPTDFVATMTELTAVSIAEAYARFAPGTVAEIVVAGGGARNPVLLDAIRRQVQQQLKRTVPVRTHLELGIDDKAKEALAFALMGYLTIQGKPGNVPSCTGATKAQVLGQIAPGDNFAQL